MTQKTRELALRGLECLRGDDLYRAKAAFKGLSAKEMGMPHGQSGRTRQAVLDGYQSRDDEFAAAIAEISAERAR